MLLLLVLWAAGCGRTALEPGVRNGDAATPTDRPTDMGADRPRDAVDGPTDSGGPACVPATEVCNGKDDDCDGLIDEEQPPYPCPNGGFRYCVGGTYSVCPVRCDVCLAKSERICFRTFCTYWGKQICADDGRSFGSCMESPVPRECEQISKDKMHSRELEQCCIDNNYCCRDEFDLDHDGDTGDMVGHCEAVMCTGS
jgi:hypothetical protein